MRIETKCCLFRTYRHTAKNYQLCVKATQRQQESGWGGLRSSSDQGCWCGVGRRELIRSDLCDSFGEHTGFLLLIRQWKQKTRQRDRQSLSSYLGLLGSSGELSFWISCCRLCELKPHYGVWSADCWFVYSGPQMASCKETVGRLLT